MLPSLPLPSDLNLTAHIAAVRLLPLHAPYKQLIGAVLLTKTSAKTAVGITGKNVEVLAGEHNLEVFTKEQGCLFNYDFAQFPDLSLYSAERERLCRVIGRSVVCQLGADVGILSVLLAKQGSVVIANEASQYGYSQLMRNAVHCKAANLHAYSLEPADLLVQLVSAELKGTTETPDRYFMLKSPQVAALPQRIYQHLVVNSPNPYNVLENLYGLYKSKAAWSHTPTLHFYDTCDSQNIRQEILRRLNSVWRYKLSDTTNLCVHCVRGRLYCVSLDVPTAVTQADEDEVESEGEVDEIQPADDSAVSKMQQDINFMRQSMQNLVSPNSLLLSNLPSLFLSTIMKRKADAPLSESPAKLSKS